MKKPRLSADQRRAEIIRIAAKMANDNGLSSVSQRTVGPKCKDINYHGVKYHFPTKRELHEAVYASGLMTEEAVNTARDLGLI